MRVAIATRDDIDIREIIKRSPVASVPDAEDILRDCMYRSVSIRYGFLDGEVACMWGLIPPTLLSDSAWLWLLTTDIVAEHKFLFIRNSQRWIEEALEIYPCIKGDVILDNAPAKRWLKWLGATFQEPIHGRIPFTIKARNG